MIWKRTMVSWRSNSHSSAARMHGAPGFWAGCVLLTASLSAFGNLPSSQPAIQPSEQQLPPGTRSVADEDVAAADQYKKAQAALDAQNYTEAERLLADLVKQDPKNAGMLYQLGFSQEAQDKDDAAEASYKAAVAIDPKQFESTLALGLVQARKGSMAEARETLKLALTLQPADASQSKVLKARAFRALAQIDVTRDPASAREWLLAALKLTPATPDDTLMAAELADTAGDTAGAQAQYKKLLAGDTRSAEAVVSYARFLMRHGQTAEATPLLEQLQIANPGDANLKRLLAHLYTQANNPEKAEPMLRSALAATPDDPTLLDDLGSALVLEKKFDEAQPVLEKAVSISADKWPSPQDLGEAWGHLAFAASENHQPKIVLQALSNRATLLPTSPSTLFLEATANDSLHQTDKAVALYQQFLSVSTGKYPDQEWQARHRLAALKRR